MNQGFFDRLFVTVSVSALALRKCNKNENKKKTEVVAFKTRFAQLIHYHLSYKLAQSRKTPNSS